MANTVVSLTDATFDDEVDGSGHPYLVDFWADWCQPCLALEPLLDALAAEQAGRLRVGRINILRYPEVAERFEVRTVPTLLVFRDGAVVKRMFGATGKRALLARLAEFIG